MDILNVARKDLRRVFHSPFALIMMFGAPLLIAGLLYFAFSGIAGGESSYTLAQTRVVVVNLDQAPQAGPFKAGDLLIQFLQNEDLEEILQLSVAADEASARAAVDHQEVDVALIIPVHFTAAALAPNETASVILYQDPRLTIGPGIVKDLVNPFMDVFSGAKIAARVSDSEEAAVQYADYLGSSSHTEALRITPPLGQSEQEASEMSMIGPIMAGIMILFVFFMGGNGAESIITEHEEGTLARLFTTLVSAGTILAERKSRTLQRLLSTPIQRAEIIGGHVLAMFLIIFVQQLILVLVGQFVFGVEYMRQPLAILLMIVVLSLWAASLGLLISALSRKEDQVITLSLIAMFVFAAMGGAWFPLEIAGKTFAAIRHEMPTAWAMDGFQNILMRRLDFQSVLMPAGMLLTYAVAFFGLAV